MRPIANGDNGPAVVGLVQVCMDFAAQMVGLCVLLGDAERAATCARHCVRIAKDFGLYEEKE